MLVYGDREVGTMVEEICDADVRKNFEDAECGPDPFHPSDDECSSSDVNTVDDSLVESSNDDDEIKEVYADPPPPARMDQESRRVAQDRVNDNRCAAVEHCGMKSTPLHEKAQYA